VPPGGLEDGGCSYDVHMGAARRVCTAKGNLERSEVDDVRDRVFVERPLEEVEVGDEYVGKVVKTTTFGAFIELSKGTDGLLHISNVSPGSRVESVEEVMSKGDEVTVRVVEVDRERGRIGLRLSHDPEIAGKSVEELSAVGSGVGGGGGGRDRDRGDRGGDRSRRGSGRPRRDRD